MTTDTTQDEKYIRRAVELATANVTTKAGGPFGCVIVKDGTVLAEGENRVTGTSAPTAHAEIVAIRRACGRLGTHQLDGAVLYSSTLPCPMCLAAIYWARPERVVYACTAEDAAAAGFDDALIYDELAKPMAQRQIPMSQLLRDEGLASFELWKRSLERVHY